MAQSYREIHQLSLTDPSTFWAQAAAALEWFSPWRTVLDDSRPPFYRWFAGATTNICHNALDRHVRNGRSRQPALIWDSAMTGEVRILSYGEMLDLTARTAGALRQLGVEKGDRVLIYMPMVPEAAIAMLACARIGAVHSVVFGGFAANELKTRIDDAMPKVVIAASCGLEPGRMVPYKPLLDAALAMSEIKPAACLILQRPQQTCSMLPGRDHDWHATIAQAAPVACEVMAATDPLYVLYTSGTTGLPKGVVRDIGGYQVALAWSMENLYAARPSETFWTASDVGWVVGHSYIVYGPLLHGCTTLMFEGKPVGTPDAGAFWRIVEQHKVSILFTAPTAFRAIRRDDPDGKSVKKYDLSSLRSLFLAGERCDPDTLLWAQEQFKIPVIDHWWQTETGWAIAANCLGLERLPVKPGSPSCAVPGWDVQALDSDGNRLEAGEKIGTLAVKLPLPPGSLTTLWQNDEGFLRSYLSDYPGYYKTGDAGYIDEEGYIYVMSRTDDIINVAGHRLSTGGIEEVLASHPDIAECAVIGVADSIKGQAPLGLLVLKAGVSRPHDQIVKEIVARVRERIGPVAAFKSAVVVARLPKTRSGKILRATMQKIADAQNYKPPATIDDPAILDEIAQALKEIGYAAENSA